MLILGPRPGEGPRPRLRQDVPDASSRSCLGIALDRGVRIVANAGGLNPAGLADAVRALAERLGLHGQRRARRGRRPAARAPPNSGSAAR